MSDSESPLELDSLQTSNRGSSLRGILIGAVLGSMSVIGVFLFLRDRAENSLADPLQSLLSSSSEHKSTGEDPVTEIGNTPVENPIKDGGRKLKNEQVVFESTAPDPTVTLQPNIESNAGSITAEADSPESGLPIMPLSAEKPKGSDLITAAQSDPVNENKQTANPATGTNQQTEKQEQREEIKLSNRRWTNLVFFQNPAQGDFPIPENFFVWNYPKGYGFKGSGFDQHRLGGFKVDGEFIIRDGYLRREFGNSALLHLPPAENFDLEGIASFEGLGGWLMLVGWNIESKSGYVIYNTKLKNGSVWFAIEIKDGKPVEKSERVLVTRRVEGEGALRVRVEDKTISMQVADAYLFRDEALPNYQEGHVAIGTYSPSYGPQNIGIKSLRMMLR